jgi:hypothetical protein
MSSPYFIVHSVTMADGVALVDGRLGEEALRIGHLFVRSFSSTSAWTKREDGVPCALVVQAIEAYQRKLDELSPGMTARLSLAGSHLSAVKPTSVIE